MRLPGVMAAVLLVGAFTACGGGLRTSYDFNPAGNFSSYQTYAWMELPDNPQLSDLNKQRVRSSIEAALNAKGMRRVDANPDVWLGYQVILDESVSYTTVNDYYGGGWGYGGWYGGGYGGGMSTSRTTENRVTVGTLIIDMFDGQSRELVYRGTGESEIQMVNDPAERQRRLDAAVTEILATYPPSAS